MSTTYERSINRGSFHFKLWLRLRSMPPRRRRQQLLPQRSRTSRSNRFGGSYRVRPDHRIRRPTKIPCSTWNHPFHWSSTGDDRDDGRPFLCCCCYPCCSCCRHLCPFPYTLEPKKAHPMAYHWARPRGHRKEGSTRCRPLATLESRREPPLREISWIWLRPKQARAGQEEEQPKLSW